MRLKDQQNEDNNKYKVLIVDDDPGIIDTLKVVINKEKYSVTGYTDPDDAFNEMKNKNYDIMILDFLLEKVTGKEVVEQLRKFNNDIYIILLTGYKDMAPPIETLIEFDIQGYCEKSDRFDQLLLLIESAVKSITLTRKLIKFHEGMNTIIDSVPGLHSRNPLNDVVLNILKQVLNISTLKDGFFISCMEDTVQPIEEVSIMQGVGTYEIDAKELYTKIVSDCIEPIRETLKKKEIVLKEDKAYLPLINEFNDESTILCLEGNINSELYDIVKVFIKNAQATYNNTILHTIINKKNNDLNSMLGQLEQNISKRKSLEAELQQTQKMEVVGRLTGGIAHDFNNILLIISGYSDMLLKRLDKEDPLYHKVSQIKKAGDRATGLIKQLMAFSRKQHLNKKPLFVNEIIVSIKNMVDVILGSQIDLDCDLYEHLWKTMLDRTQMEQVIMNLVVNAKDAMPDGGKIIITSRNVAEENISSLNRPEIEVRDYIQLSVKDTGQGIKPDVLPNIFDPFYTTKKQGKGTGLGLSTVYGIIKQMDGYIYVESEIGEGTTFNIYLPRIDISDDQEDDESIEIELTGNETILVVDDEDEIKSYVSSVLSQNGYTVFKTNHPHEALELYNQNNIDFILTDMIMPEMNGKQLVQKLKEQDPDLKFLFMSGFVNSELIEQGIYYNKSNFIEKPFSPEKLLRKIRLMLGVKKTGEPLETA